MTWVVWVWLGKQRLADNAEPPGPDLAPMESDHATCLTTMRKDGIYRARRQRICTIQSSRNIYYSNERLESTLPKVYLLAGPFLCLRKRQGLALHKLCFGDHWHLRSDQRDN
jgi:hypothetical protein